MTHIALLLMAVFTGFSVQAASQSYQSANALIRQYFGITQGQASFNGRTPQGTACQIFIKDKSREASNPVDEIQIVGQFQDGHRYHQLAFQLGPESRFSATPVNGGVAYHVANVTWAQNTMQTMILQGQPGAGLPVVTLQHHTQNIGTADYGNSCLNLK